MYLQSAHFPFGPQGAFYRGQFVIWPRVLIIMLCAVSKPSFCVIHFGAKHRTLHVQLQIIWHQRQNFQAMVS